MGHRKRRNDARGVARRLAGAMALAGLGLVAGCRTTGEPGLTYLGDADLNYYLDRATSVAAPDVRTVAADNVATMPPHTVNNRSRDTIRDVTLTEAIHLCLANSEVIRERGQFLAPSNPLLTNPEAAASIYDPAIQETTVQFGNRGVEAALADFDALLTTQMVWGRDERVQNSLFGFGTAPGQTLVQDTAQFRGRLEKPTATGGTVAVTHQVDYEFNNAPNRLFDSAYTGNVAAEFRHPLLAGAGVDFNRIAGPQSRNFARTSGLSNGVLVARINNDIEVAEFQRAARNLLREVEDAYWNLYLAYRVYDAEVIARDSSLTTWRLVQERRRQGLQGGGTADEAQARASYFDARARVEASLGDLYRRELELRRICGLPVNDGSILRPIDEPVVAEFRPDWHTALCEALTGRTELRRQKWQIKSLELQLAAANNLARPSLDFVSRYRVNGFGDKLISRTDNDKGNTPEGLNGFYNTLTDGDQTGWDLGFELTTPLGLRSAKSQVRNYELRLAKSRAALATMEHEVSHELAVSFQEVDRFYKVAQTRLNGRVAAEEQVRANETRFQLGGIGGGGGEGGGGGGGTGTAYLDLLLRSQIALAQAESTYWQAVVQYNQAIADLHVAQDTLLERDGVSLSEGTWSPAAYKHALREAWHRSHAFKNPLLDTEPDPFAFEGEHFPTAVPGPLDCPVPGGAPADADAVVPPAPAPEGEAVPGAPPAEPIPDTAPADPLAEELSGGPVTPTSADAPADATPVTPGSRFGHVRTLRGVTH